MKKVTQSEENLALFSQKLEYIQKDVAEIKDRLDNKYVTKEEFATVKTIAYGLVGLILVGVIGSIMTSILK